MALIFQTDRQKWKRFPHWLGGGSADQIKAKGQSNYGLAVFDGSLIILSSGKLNN